MVIRSFFKCLTCDHPHIVRIGMGQEEYQAHTISCAGCGEEMSIGLRVNYDQITAIPEAIDNCEMVKPFEQGTVINVHANFTIPTEQQNDDGVFPHLQQMMEMTKRSIEQNATTLDKSNGPKILPLFSKRPNIAEEWKLLKKAWSLHRRGQNKISRKIIDEASEIFYDNELLPDINDWLWRFLVELTGKHFEKLFSESFDVVFPLLKDSRFTPFSDYYCLNLSPAHARRYFAIIQEFFSGYSDYSQIYFQVRDNFKIDKDHMASSVNFNVTRMFYGNTYEAFMSSVDVLTYLNNMICDRDFDQFQRLTIEKYQKLDKPSRCDPFKDNVPFSKLCIERDNQLRNASHHGSFNLDPETQIIKYQSGKGGSGPVREILYIHYLERSTNIFLQLMTIFRIEIAMSHLAKIRYPL